MEGCCQQLTSVIQAWLGAAEFDGVKSASATRVSYVSGPKWQSKHERRNQAQTQFVQNDGRYWYSDLRADDSGVYEGKPMKLITEQSQEGFDGFSQCFDP